MTISIIRPGLFLALTAGLLLSAEIGAQDNPHWDKAACQTCHAQAAPVAGQVNLNAADAEALCDTCHGDRGDAMPCRHVSGVPSGRMAIPDVLSASLKNDQVVCSTCHDVVYQCEHPSAHYAAGNVGFLRARTSYKTSDFCLKCHNRTDFEKLNPHSGVAGSPTRPTCQLCHAAIPESGKTGSLVVNFNMQHDLNDTCFGCHNVKPHPRRMTFGGGPKDAESWVHFVQPSETVLANMRETQEQTGVALPLNPISGEVFCATCHNPHDFKIGGEHGSQDPAIGHRLRLNNICQACHDK